MCTYEDCTETDQQYDNIKDWVAHEVNAHPDKFQPASPSDQSSDAHSERQDPRESPPQSRPPNLANLRDIRRKECPICLEQHASFGHVALHLRKIAVFALPKSAGPDGDSTLGDPGSKDTNIDDQNSVLSVSAIETSDKDDLHGGRTDEYSTEWDARTSKDVAPGEKISQEVVRRLELALQQVQRSAEKGPDMSTFFARLDPDNTLIYQGESNRDEPASKIHSFPVDRYSDLNNISFYVRIDTLNLNYQAQPIRYGAHNYWAPPNVRTGYTRSNSMLFCWTGGIMTRVAHNLPGGQTYSSATIFTQNPDTPHLLAVPFDAERTHAYLNPGGWRPLVFHHIKSDNTQRTYSAVSTVGDRQHIAARGSSHWMPQLLPSVYDYQTGSPRIQAGLIGSVPLLIALAAFSAPPAALETVLTSCLRPGLWRPHQWEYPAGRKYYCNMESST